MTWKELVKKVGEFEGFRAKVYKDAVGVKTIGFGFCQAEYIKMGEMTEEQARDILDKLLKAYYDKVKGVVKATGLTFNQNELYALTSFAYNLGLTNTARLMHIDGDVKKGYRSKKQIANAIPLYNKAGGKVLNGLVKRRAWEKELFLSTVSDVENYTAKELQELVNKVIKSKSLHIDKLKVDGKIGSKSINALAYILERV